MSKTDIKKGDEVVVIAGAEKGKRGEILNYTRAAEREAAIHRSNVMLASLWDARRAKKPAAKAAKATK